MTRANRKRQSARDVARYVDSLAALYGRATWTDKREGQRWYPTARGAVYDIAKRWGVSLKRAAYAAAALSNNMEWDANLELLEHAVAVVKSGGVMRGHFGICLTKARAILERGQFSALSGPKVVPFAAAIMGDGSAAVVDRWIFRAADIRGSVTDRKFRDVQTALRILARRVHRPVSTVQAVVWVVVRREASRKEQT